MPLEDLNVGEDLTYQEYPVKFWKHRRRSPEIRDTECAKCNGAIIVKKKLPGKEKIS